MAKDCIANLTAAEFGVLMAKALLEIQSSAAWFVFQTAVKEIPDNEDMEYGATEEWLRALIARSEGVPVAQGLPSDLTHERIARGTEGRFKDWIFVQHPDGQWVTVGKLDDKGLAMLGWPLTPPAAPGPSPAEQTHAGNPDVYPRVGVTRKVVGHVEPAPSAGKRP